jgi:hypothetical protein
MSDSILDVFKNHAKRLLSDISRRHSIDKDNLYSRFFGESPGVMTSPSVHNHLPVRWLVPGCTCCNENGNVFIDFRSYSTTQEEPK